MSHDGHPEALDIVEQLLGGILSLPPHLPPSLVSPELQHRHRLLGLSPSSSSSTPDEAVDFLFTDVYSFGSPAQEEVMQGLDGLRLQLERGGAMGSGVDARTVVKAIVTSVVYQHPEPTVLLARIGLGRSEDAEWNPQAVDRPLIFVMLRSEGDAHGLSSARVEFKFDGLQPSRTLPGSWHSTLQGATTSGHQRGEDMDMDQLTDSGAGRRGGRADGARQGEENGEENGNRSDLIDNAEDFWAGVDDDDEAVPSGPGGGERALGGEDEETMRREEEAAEAAYWAGYDQVSGSPTAGGEAQAGSGLDQGMRGAGDVDLSLESLEEEADRKRKRARGAKETQDQDATARIEERRAMRQAAIKEMLKGAWKLASADEATNFSEVDFVRIAREAVREAQAEAHGRGVTR